MLVYSEKKSNCCFLQKDHLTDSEKKLLFPLTSFFFTEIYCLTCPVVMNVLNCKINHEKNSSFLILCA